MRLIRWGHCAVVFLCALTCSCGYEVNESPGVIGDEYPASEPPDGALPREVTTEIDFRFGLGERELPASIQTGSEGQIPMQTGPRGPSGNFVLVPGDGVQIEFDKEVTIEGTTFNKGTVLQKVNGWWCSAE
jgi:hypothetical protein